MIDEWGNISDGDIATPSELNEEPEQESGDIEEAPEPDRNYDDEGRDDDDDDDDVGNDDDIPDNDDDDEEEQGEDDYIYPEYVPDELIVPESFKDAKEELEWFRANYFDALEISKHESVRKYIVGSYKEHLMQAEDDYLKLKSLKDAFDDNPRALFKMYFSKELEEAGVSLALSDADKNTVVARKLAEEFGDDYYTVYNPNNATNPNSISNRIYRRNEELYAELERTPETNQPDITELINEAYEKDFSDMDRSDYDKFISEVKDYNVTIKDLYHAFKHQELIEKAFKDGKVAGRREVGKELQPQGKRVRKAPTYTEPTDDDTDRSEMLDEFASKFFK